MPFASQYQNLRFLFLNCLSKLELFGLNLFLGVSASTFMCKSASAAESVVLVYNETLIQTSITTIQAFASRNKLDQDLQQFFRKIPQNPNSVRNFLTTRIPLSSALIERNFETSTGQFLLIQLDKLLGITFRQENLEPLRTALVAAYGDDNRLSILELIEEYPESEIRVDLRSLEKVYNDTNDFITRLQPLLAVTKDLLPELVCECDSSSRMLKTDTSATDSSKLVVSANGTRLGLPAPKPSCSNAVAQLNLIAASEAIALLNTEASVKTLVSSTANTAPKKLSNTVQFLGTSAVTPLAATPTSATKRLVLTFGSLAGSLSVKDLETFAATGQVPSSVSFYLNLANLQPEDFRKTITQEVQVSYKILDEALNSLLGEYLLFQVGQVIHTRSRRANIQALRSALVLSAIGDNRISLLEFLQKYPNQQIYVNGVRLARIGRLANRGVEGLEGLIVDVQASVANRVCDCNN